MYAVSRRRGRSLMLIGIYEERRQRSLGERYTSERRRERKAGEERTGCKGGRGASVSYRFTANDVLVFASTSCLFRKLHDDEGGRKVTVVGGRPEASEISTSPFFLTLPFSPKD
jgi:hypothetical protein